MQRMTLIGRLTRDVELKTTSTTGAAVVNNAVAVSRYKLVNGEKQEETCFFEVSFFGRIAEVVSQYVRKGHKVFVDGYFQQQTWVDKTTNQNRSKLVLIVENIEMLEQQPQPSAVSQSANNAENIAEVVNNNGVGTPINPF